MREILFRGKRKSDGKWIEGSLCTTLPSDAECYTISYFDEDIYYTEEDVDPETVGQFTGLTDKNGKKIFEGDILKYKSNKNENKISYVMYGMGCFSVKNIYTENRPAIDIVLFETDNNVEVIGNIHDNPELLKGGENG